jgi:KaiC/GvpD/RAD55 family RecA-like ATPase
MLLFADTGLGKSALAIQIGDAIAGGMPFEPFGVTTEPQRVFYIDFELTDEQFAARYTDPDESAFYADTDLLFSQNLIRSPPRENPYQPEEFDNYYSFLIHSVTDLIKFSKARVVIVDNITWLSASTEHSAAAQRLMRVLVELKNRLGLSIMVIAHTPKMRRGVPVELNHLQGSKMLANFADNIIGMGRSCTSTDLRYLKPLKQRNAAARFDEKCVPVFRLTREGRMLGFTFVDNEPEHRHLDGLRGVALADAIRHDRMTRVTELANAGDTVRAIAEKLGIGKSSVSRYLSEIAVETALTEKIAKNPNVCPSLSQTRPPQAGQESEFLNEKEASSESPHQ